VGVAPYSQSRHHETPKLNKELPKDYEIRTWKEKLNTDDNGIVFIPALAFKNCIAEIAKFLSVQIPSKGKSTYTKHFRSGIMVLEDASLGIHKDEVLGNWLHVPANGERGGSKRVMKCFPYIPSGWRTSVEFIIVDDMITEDVFRHHLRQAGQLIGVGTFRPANQGTYGRFTVESVAWGDYE
jgi:hypothetical protein